MAARFWSQPGLEALLAKHGRVAVGVSGGADSMALLFLMAGPCERPEWAPEVVAAHVNHGLRGAESDADEARVARLARELGVAFRHRRLRGEDLRSSAKGEGIESAARSARYKALRDILRQSECGALVLAHHQDDLAETFLMRLLRGSGLMGLGGFGPEAEVEGITLVRPLIDWPREEVREVARQAGLDWGEDSMNLDTRLVRNRLRHRVLPYLDRMTDHPPVVRMLARTARCLEAEAGVLRAHVENLYGEGRRERSEPRRVGLPRAVVAANDALFAPYLLRLLMCDVLESPYPPSAERVSELVRFALEGKAKSLHQSASNVVMWLDADRTIWGYRKPERKIERKRLVEIFEKSNLPED